MKKITSEISSQTNEFKVKWGTIDKKNPAFIYLELGTYITPKKEEEDYRPFIKKIEKEGKSIVKNAVMSMDEIKKDFIFVTDVADTRISYGKKSYLTFQIHVGRKKSDVNDFKTIISNMNMKWSPVYEKMAENLEVNGFSCSKTKN